jgi:hypothetical protein
VFKHFNHGPMQIGIKSIHHKRHKREVIGTFAVCEKCGCEILIRYGLWEGIKKQ